MMIAPQADLQAEFDLLSPGRARLVFRGWLNTRTVGTCWPGLEQELPAAKLQALEVDVAGVEVCDEAALAFLRYLDMGKMTPTASVSIKGLEPEMQKNFQGFTLRDYDAFHTPTRRKCSSLPEETGAAAAVAWADTREQVAFLGAAMAGLVTTILDRRHMRWAEVRHVFELAGANAVPIISLISFLVGVIIAFETSQPLAQFGAQIFVANMIGLVMVRELGPLLAAVLLAGRSGSAFAAEIGTMKVNEELDALETFGLRPIKFLVVQRITAGILLAPLLTLYSTFMGIVGGVLVTLSLGFPLSLIVHQMSTSVHLSDVALGLIKGTVFGAIVAAVGCLRGLQTREGPSAVGVSTTRAVVTSILLIVIADAIFSILYYFLVP